MLFSAVSSRCFARFQPLLRFAVLPAICRMIRNRVSATTDAAVRLRRSGRVWSRQSASTAATVPVATTTAGKRLRRSGGAEAVHPVDRAHHPLRELVSAARTLCSRVLRQFWCRSSLDMRIARQQRCRRHGTWRSPHPSPSAAEAKNFS